MNKLKLVATIGLSFALMGCFESRKNTEQLCEANPALRCEMLNVDDGQCRLPRTDLIWHRFDLIKTPSDENKIKEYHILAEYEKCLTLAAQIQPLTQSERKSKRFTTVMHVSEEQDRIVAELKQSTSPQALYFLWSQEGDEAARRSFLQLEGTPVLETAEMQYALATFYTSRDAIKTLQLLHRSLELSNGKNTNIDVIKSLASLNLQQNRKELAYIWTQVAEQFDVKTASKKNNSLLYGFTDEKYQQLDNMAEQVHEAIEDGKYRANMINKTW
ncbi:DUF2989 domain-containing protein [Vibrio sp. 404]|uniref:DUF2989 domain-containing protein n=1 Tax=Vibrio marinisediminis TaxID=2758441 RepID=A0A7W2FQM0_9VIBR|nr:DUF2989 domain-containing protein [Vibrio marinisediminis]MBA5762440.1 DUF2989 domain-containing protein [Vibrio marinisediminis]